MNAVLGPERGVTQRERDRPRGRGERNLHLGRRPALAHHSQEHQHEGNPNIYYIILYFIFLLFYVRPSDFLQSTLRSDIAWVD